MAVRRAAAQRGSRAVSFPIRSLLFGSVRFGRTTISRSEFDSTLDSRHAMPETMSQCAVCSAHVCNFYKYVTALKEYCTLYNAHVHNSEC